jgi:hypothetical protein
MSEVVKKSSEISERRAQIEELKQVLMALPDAITDFTAQTFHHFSHGVYGREFWMPKGQVVVGKIHRYPCINVFIKGKVVVTSSSDDVEPGTILEPGRIWVSKPGTQRAVYALEDSIWFTAHPNPGNETDLLVIEENLIVKNFEALEMQI